MLTRRVIFYRVISGRIRTFRFNSLKMYRGNLLTEFKPLLKERGGISLLPFLLTALLFQGCGVAQNPVKKIQSELKGEKEYAIILNDMREQGQLLSLLLPPIPC